MGSRRLAATLCASLSLGACSYTSPVVAPPADIRPPPAAQLEPPDSPDEEADEALRAFRDAIAAYSEAVRWAEAARRPRLAAGPYRGSSRVSAAVREFRAETARLHPADRVLASDQQILAALRASERALIALYTALARGE